MGAKLFPQYFAAFSAAFGVFALGACIGWTNPAQKIVQNGDLGFSVSEEEFSWVGSLLMFGACFVCIPIGFIMKALGRRFTMLLLIIPFYLGWALLLLASNVIMLCIARFLLGIAGGAFCICCPVYTAEIAQKEIRGALGTFFQLLITGGVLFAYIIGSAKDIKLLNYTCAVLPVIYFILVLFAPESPVFLLNKGKEEQAAAAMQRLRGDDFDCTPEINEMKASSQKAKDSKTPIGSLLVQPVNIKALTISILLMALQQLSGINAVVFYSTFIFDKGNTGLSAEVATIIVGVMLFLSTFISTAVVDSFGRKLLLLISAIFMGIATLLFGFYFYKMDEDEASVENISWLPIVSLCVFIITFSIGLGPVPWLFMSEVFSDEVRDVAGSISGTTNWAFAFIVTKCFMVLQNSIGTGMVFWLFSLICFLGVVFIILVLPETKGKSTAEIQAELGG